MPRPRRNTQAMLRIVLGRTPQCQSIADSAGEALLERQSPAAELPKDQRSASPGRAINGKNHSIQRRHRVPDHWNIRR